MDLSRCAPKLTWPAKATRLRRRRPIFARLWSCSLSALQRKRSETGLRRNRTFLPWRSVLPKLPPLSGEEVCRILERHGFLRVRQRGSHVIMQRRNENSTITVPVPVPVPSQGTEDWRAAIHYSSESAPIISIPGLVSRTIESSEPPSAVSFSTSLDL
jgi:predicted RNA binding protein YcfA (HicA-like mRNA interferase family)